MFVCVWREKRGRVVYISLMCGAVLCEKVLASLTDKQMLILALRRLINIDLGG